MIDEYTLSRLAETVAPSDGLRQKVKNRIHARIQPEALLVAVAQVSPSLSFAARIRARILQSLAPIQEASLFASSLKWASAFAVFLVIIRSLPVIFLAPSTSAEVGVQLIPVDGEVSVYIGGVWTDVKSPQMLTSSAMIRTGVESHATLIKNDDGVFRLGPSSVFKLHDIADLPTIGVSGPTATLVHGQIWVLGLPPSVSGGLSIEISTGIVSVNVGSVGISDDGMEATVTVYDRGATVQHGEQTTFVVTGEQVVVRGSSALQITSLPTVAFTTPWALKNLEQDAVHRHEIAKLQEERREKIAGILPTSFLYPAKRLAEHVDVFFTLTEDGRTEKRITQANTRLSEAIALMKAGQSDEAAAPLSEYKDSLIAMAADSQDNLVNHLLKQQIADASVSIGSTGGASANLELLKSALAEVGTAVPNAALDAKDIEGYVLVDRLAQINQQLSHSRDIEGAASAYASIRPYVKSLLAEGSGVHPLLKKEATSLLLTTSTLIQEAQKVDQSDVLVALASDIAPYIPQSETVRASADELNTRVQAMYERIFIFRAPLSRYNQLRTEMAGIYGDPDHGSLLRRLRAALPEGLGEYVNTEIQLLSDELKTESTSVTTLDVLEDDAHPEL